MTKHLAGRRLTRRTFLGVGGSLAAAAGSGLLLPRWKGPVLAPRAPSSPAQPEALQVNVRRHLAATDGWIKLNGSVPPYAPDPFAPPPRTTYCFGFRDLTALDPNLDGSAQQNLILAQKGRVQASAPLLYFDELDNIQIDLTNLGLQQRPDLVDSHTIHWHGFRNALPLFDGVPEMSISVPIGSTFPYFYHPHDPGTYMYHCHFEDVEHVQMGMQGIIFVRPAQNKTGNGAGAPVARYNGGPANAPLGYAYNDGVALGDPESTAYDREYSLFLADWWAQSHYSDAHIQQVDWSDYHADFYLMNGRSYPDTLLPNGGGTTGGGIDPNTGDLIAPAGHPELQYQPLSSLIQCNAGERVLLRFVNLGYTQASMRLAGIPMHVVGKDATPRRGISGGARTGADTSYYVDTIYLGAGESYDAIFLAPSLSAGSTMDTYLLYNNALGALTTPGGSGLGGQMTHIHVYPAGTLPPQTTPNDLPFHD